MDGYNIANGGGSKGRELTDEEFDAMQEAMKRPPPWEKQNDGN